MLYDLLVVLSMCLLVLRLFETQKDNIGSLLSTAEVILVQCY